MTQSKRLSPEELAQIAERCEKATEGPWDDFSEGLGWVGNVYRYDELTDTDDMEIAHCLNKRNNYNDAAFIANARQDIPKLLAEIERLISSVETIRELTSCKETEDFAERTLKGTEKITLTEISRI